jgi:hypothetical protein
VYCSPACRQRAHRLRARSNRNAPAVTATSTPRVGHCAEALALLAELDAELAENSAELGSQQPLVWTAAERAVRELIADTVDRKADLWQRYVVTGEDAARVRLSAEIRLLETSLARLLRQVRTELPAPQSRISQKAAKAARVRWQRAAT